MRGRVHSEKMKTSTIIKTGEDGFLTMSNYTNRSEVCMNSKAIPLPKSHIHRTESEILLSENMEQAEWQDQCMFNRLVAGLSNQQQLLYNVESHDPQRRHSLQTRQIQNASNDDNGYFISCSESDLHSPSKQTMSSSPDLMAENRRRIENIISTRQAPVMMNCRSCSQVSLGRLESLEECNTEIENDFGEIFDLEM